MSVAVATPPERVDAGHPRAAIDAFKPLRGTIAWSDAAVLWAEAVDGWVAEERERAGARRARRLP